MDGCDSVEGSPYNSFVSSILELFAAVTSYHKPPGNGFDVKWLDEHLAACLLALKQKLNLLDKANLEDSLTAFVPWGLRFISESLQREELTEVSIKCRGSIISIINSAFNITDGSLSPNIAESALSVMLQVMRLDAEPNGISALHLIVDLHKKFRSSLEDTVKHVVDTAKYLLSRFESTVKANFSEVPLFLCFQL